MTQAVSIAQSGTNNVTMRNRIINGAMMIDQRNAGASVTITSTVADTYTLDRWSAFGSQASKFTVQQNAGSVTPPTGFTKYLGATVGASANVTVGSTDAFRIGYYVEGFNVADLNWGSASASTITISFWVRSSVTGTYGAALSNSAYNRGYPFTYTINSANTWEQKTITIAGDTTGTWVTDNGLGLRIYFGLGVGSSGSGTAGAWAASGYGSATGAVNWISTNSATFYITGVQLEAGTTATPFEQRLYGTEFALCQRYYYRSQLTAYAPIFICNTHGTGNGRIVFNFPVAMRTPPTGITLFGTAPSSGYGTYSGLTFDRATTLAILLQITGSGFVAGGATVLFGSADGTTGFEFTGTEL